MKARLTLTGNVQGVGFRWFARKRAIKLGIRLLQAENKPDGRTLVLEIEGVLVPVQNFIAWAKRGPASSKVENADIIYW